MGSTKPARPSELPSYVADTIAAAAKLIDRSATVQNDAIATLTGTLESQARQLRLKDETISLLTGKTVEQAEKIGELLRANADLVRAQNDREVMLAELETRRERSRQVWGTVRAIGMQVLGPGALAGILPGGAPSAPVDAPSDAAKLAIAFLEVFMSLSQDTQSAIIADAGREKVERLVALVMRHAPQNGQEQPAEGGE